MKLTCVNEDEYPNQIIKLSRNIIIASIEMKDTDTLTCKHI